MWNPCGDPKSEEGMGYLMALGYAPHQLQGVAGLAGILSLLLSCGSVLGP
jgi:hypothetical protein